MPGAGFIGAVMRRRRRLSTSDIVSITASVAPASSPLLVGDALKDTVNWSAFLDPANYATTAPGETIAEARINYLGDTANADEIFADGDANWFGVSVTDTGGNTHVFPVAARTVVHAPPTASGALTDQSFTQGTGLQTVDVSGRFSGGGLNFAVNNTSGVGIDSAAGLLSFDTDALALQSGTLITVTATNSGGSVTGTFRLDVAQAQTIPAQMSAPDVVADNPTQITATLAAAPDDGGGAITEYDLRYRVNGGTWTSVQDVTSPVTLSAFSEAETVDVQTRAQNAIGNGAWSASGSATTPLAAPASAGALADQSFLQNTGMQTYDISGGFSGSALTYAVNPVPGISIDSSTGVVSFDTGTLAAQAGTRLTVTATNVSGSVQGTFDLYISIALVAPVLSASDSFAGRTLTIAIDSLTGVPAPVASLTTLTLDGVDVLGGQTGSGPWQYTVPSSGAAQTVAWTVIGTNSQGSDTDSGSEVLAADLGVPAQMSAPVVVVNSATRITVTLAADPTDGGSAITQRDIRYRVNGGSWTVQNGVTSPVALDTFSEQDSIDVQNRSRNAVGTGIWSVSRGVTTPLAPPVSAGLLADRIFARNSGIQTYDVSGDFTGSNLTFSVTGIVGVSISPGTGVLSVDTGAMALQTATTVIVTATNANGVANSGFSLSIAQEIKDPVNTVTIAENTVSEDLAGFPVKVDMGDLSAELWSALRADGGNLRATNAADTVNYPLDIAWLDPIARKGTLFVKRDLAAAADTRFVLRARDAGTAAAAVTDPDGRNAVWADYLAVLAFPDQVDRTGNGSVATGGSTGAPSSAAFTQAGVSGPVTANQGVAWDGMHWYLISTNEIRKYDADWNLVLSNNDPIGDTNISGVNHAGDGTIVGGELFLPIEVYPNNPYNNQHICVFNSTDLTFNRSYDISAQGHECSSIGYNPADGLLYITDYTDGSSIYRYSTAGVYQSAVSMSETIPGHQGVEFLDGEMYITASRDIYRATLSGIVAPTPVMSENISGTNYEGLTRKDGVLHALRDGATDNVVALTKVPDLAAFSRSWLEVSGLANQSTWTLSLSSRPNEIFGANAGLGSIQPARNASDRASMVRRSSGQYGGWNNSNGWMAPAASQSASVGVSRRIALAHDGTAERKMLLDGVRYATDPGITIKPAVRANMILNIGTANAAGSEPFYGTSKWVFLHDRYRSDVWLLAEHENLMENSTFYSMTASGNVSTGPVASEAPRISNGFDTDTFTLDTTGFTNVASYDWRVVGGTTLSTNSDLAPTQIAAGSAEGSVIECEIACDEGNVVSIPIMIYASRMMGTAMSAGHIADDRAVLALMPHAEVTHFAVTDGNWTDAATWNTGTVPADGAFVLIPFGRTITYNNSTAGIRLDRVRIDGTLTWALDQSTSMLVETMGTTRTGARIIGTGPSNRLPAAHTAEITISGVDWSAAGNDTPTDIKNSNFLETRGWGRGLINQGLSRMWGKEQFTWGFATTGIASGATSLTLNKDPVGVEVGDWIYIGATTHNYDGLSPFSDLGMQDEYRQLTGVSGRVLSWSSGLTYNHNNQLAGSTFDIAPTVMLRSTQTSGKNIIIRSEVTTPAYRRGHTVSMHHWAEVDEWDVAFLELGRTDKSFGAGVMDESGDFRYNDSVLGLTDQRVPLTSQSNLISRYPVHLHHVGFEHMGAEPIVAECYVEGTPGWGYVHHACDARFERNAGHLFYGCGMVSEQANEVNNWNDNLMAGSTNDKPRDLGSSPKNAEGNMGKLGDNFRHGEGFGYRGRAMRTNRNVAQSCGVGHLFYPRGYENGTAQPSALVASTIRPRREHLDISKQGLWNQSGFTDTFGVEAYPIMHFADNMAIACVAGGFITKDQPQQGHDVNVKLKRFKAYGCRTGWSLEYVGVYILDQFHCISGVNTDKDGSGISLGANTEQVMVINPRVEGFNRGISNYGNQGINASDYNNTNKPRYGNIGVDAVNCATDVHFENDTTYPGTVTITTEEATFTDLDLDGELIDYQQEPVISIARDLPGQADWPNGTGLTNSIGTKTDNLSSNGQVVVRTNNDRLFPLYGNRFNFWCTAHGYWQFGGDNIAAVDVVYSDRLTGRPLRKTHFVEMSSTFGSNKGAFTWTDTAITRADIYDEVSHGSSVTIDVITGCSGGTGSFALVDGRALDDYIAPDHGVIEFDVAGGELTYTPDDGDYIGPDEFYVFVTSGGQQKTVRIAIMIEATGPVTTPAATTNFTVSDATEANTVDFELLDPPDVGGRNIRTVFYSTDAGSTWRRLCHNWCEGIHKVDVASDGTTLSNGGYNFRIKVKTDHEYVFSSASGDDAVTVS